MESTARGLSRGRGRTTLVNLAVSHTTSWLLASCIVFLVVLLCCLIVFPGHLAASDNSHGDTIHFHPDSIKRHATLSIDREFELPASPDLIAGLLRNLDMTCAIIRSWNLESFRASRISSTSYRAEDGAGLRGLIREHTVSDTQAVLLGEGQYTSSAIPLTLEGRALADISFELTNGDKSRLRGRLDVQVSNPVIHLAGRLLSPVIRRLADQKTNHLIKIAHSTIITIKESPGVTADKLTSIEPSYADTWATLAPGDD